MSVSLDSDPCDGFDQNAVGSQEALEVRRILLEHEETRGPKHIGYSLETNTPNHIKFLGHPTLPPPRPNQRAHHTSIQHQVHAQRHANSA